MFITKLFATVKNWTQSTVSGGWGAGGGNPQWKGRFAGAQDSR